MNATLEDLHNHCVSRLEHWQNITENNQFEHNKNYSFDQITKWTIWEKQIREMIENQQNS